jgi:hypothetical protein
MSSPESLWIYIAIPAALVAALVLIKLKLQKTEKTIDDTPLPEEENEIRRLLQHDETNEIPDEPATVTRKMTNREAPVRPEPPPTDTEDSDEEKPAECPHYMGFLYMRKGPESAHIPNECYQCQRLLRCLYSPRIMEKLYGNGK